MSGEIDRSVDLERRALARPPKIAPRVIGRARVRPEYARHLLTLRANTWYPVVDRNSHTIPAEAQPGYVWLDLGDWLVHVWVPHLEVRLRPHQGGTRRNCRAHGSVLRTLTLIRLERSASTPRSRSVNETHDPRRTSWVESAQGATDFPIQNLPFGVFRPRDASRARVGIAIGDQILDLTTCHEEGRFTGLAERAAEACAAPSLNRLMALGREHRAELRRQVAALLEAGSPAHRANRRIGDRLLVPMAEAELLLPAEIGDYTDFYASVHHATNVGGMFRPENPLLPNYKWVPIGYHGRASSIVPSGMPVRRPSGQIKDPEADAPVFAPTRSLDYEMELGCFVGMGNRLGEPVPLERAEEHLFGVCLVNDWSARDIQSWEYQPLGPFLSKNFATTISPWVVTFEALEPFRVPAFRRPAEDPAPLPYLSSERTAAAGGLDVTVEVYLASARMREQRIEPVRLSRGRVADLYWTLAQMLAHHTGNGCDLRPGDLFASGTISGPSKESRGCLLELTMRGAEPLTLPTGETRKFLEDGDEVIMRGWCEREGAARIGLGECRGVVLGE